MNRISSNLLATIAITMALHCTVQGIADPSSRISLPIENITCIRSEFNQTNTDPSCATAEATIALLYDIDVYNVIDAIETRLDLLDAFCQQTCAQTIFEAWKTCGAFDQLRNIADLLTGLCSSNNGRPCYKDYIQLRAAVDDTYDCFHLVGSDFGSCAVDCRVALTLDTKTYGCCLNVFPNYKGAIEPDDDINEEVDHIFDECRVRRPAVCPAASTMPGDNDPASTSSNAAPVTASNPQAQNSDPAPVNQPNQQGMRNGSSQPIAVAAVLLLNSFIAAFVQHL